ncbi:MAG: hypothetical protein E7345_02775 [Clostridiales bacterium]|nr:hypothetical protein [Clostridiales bacterium]
MADKKINEFNKKVDKFVKEFIKKNSFKEKDIVASKEEDTKHKVIVSTNIFHKNGEKVKFPDNWKFEQGRGFVYSDDKVIEEIKCEFKHLEKILTPGDVLYEMQMANPEMSFKVNGNLIEFETNGHDFHVDYLKQKGFVEEEGMLVNHDILVNGEPVTVPLVAVTEHSQEGEKVEEMTSGAKMETLHSTAPDATEEKITALSNNMTEGVREKMMSHSEMENAVNDEYFNFDKMKQAYEKYKLKIINNELVVVDTETQKVLNDKKLIAEAQMAQAWHDSFVYSNTKDSNVMKDDDASRTDMAFGEEGRGIFERMLDSIEGQVKSGQGFNIEQLQQDLNGYGEHWNAREIVSALLTNESPANTQGLPIKSDQCIRRIKLLLAESRGLESLHEQTPDMINDNDLVMERVKRPNNN